MLVLSPKGRGVPRAILGWDLSLRRVRSPWQMAPCAVSPHCEQGPPMLTLLFPLCLPRSLRTQQPPLSIVAYPWPSPSSSLGHQALSDLQAQRDVTAQPLPQLQHGESQGVGGHQLLDPFAPAAVPLLHGTASRTPPGNFWLNFWGLWLLDASAMCLLCP